MGFNETTWAIEYAKQIKAVCLPLSNPGFHRKRVNVH